MKIMLDIIFCLPIMLHIGSDSPIIGKVRHQTMSTQPHQPPEIPAQHQGIDFKNSKELEIGMKVLDVFLNRNRVATVIKRYPVSVRLAYTDGNGRLCTYTESLRNLRRLPAL